MEYLSRSFLKRNLLPSFALALFVVAVDCIKVYFLNDFAARGIAYIFIFNIPLLIIVFLTCSLLLHWLGFGLASVDKKRALIRERNQLLLVLESLRQSLGSDLVNVASKNQLLAEGVIGAAQTTESAVLKLLLGVNQIHSDTRDMLVHLQRTNDMAVSLFADDGSAGFMDMIKHLEKITQVLGKISALTSLTDTIEKISIQTDQLILNAVTEADRAGEAESSLLVMAKQIRGLSVDAAKAAKQIADGIGEVCAAAKFDSKTSTDYAAGDDALKHVDDIRSSILVMMQAFVGDVVKNQNFLQCIEGRLIDLNSEFQFEDVVRQQLHAVAGILDHVDAHFDTLATFLQQLDLERWNPEAYPTLSDMSVQLGFLRHVNESSKSHQVRDGAAIGSGAIELF